MIVKRCITAAVVLGLGSGLGSCGGGAQFSGYVADHWPHWAGGMPDDVPPRPGAPGYDEFVAHGQSGQDAATPSAAGTGPVFEQAAATAAKPAVKPARAAQVAPAKNQSSQGFQPSKGLQPSQGLRTSQDVQPAQALQPAQTLQPRQDLQPTQDAGSSQDTSVVRGGLY
jgi:hypothetical protein